MVEDFSEFKVGIYVKHRQVDGIGRILSIAGDKIAVSWGKSRTTKYLVSSFRENFIVVPKWAKGSKMGDPTMHLVVKWNFNDAGYSGICSSSVIEANRDNAQIWCSASGCWKFQKKGAHRPRMAEPAGGWPCNEAALFSDFFFRTGSAWRARQEGSDGKDLVMAPERQRALKNNGRLAFMSTRALGAQEKDRYIFGLYEIGNVEDDRYEDGDNASTRVEAVVETSFLFNRDVRVPFWGVYKNRKPGEKWGQGLFRYLAEPQSLAFLEMAIRQYRALSNAPKRRRHLSILQAHLERLRPS